jgi:signal transduction histidine kinase
MKIKESLIIGNTISAGFFLFVVLVLVYQINSVYGQYENLADDELPFQQAIDNLRIGTLRVVASTSEYILLKAESQHTQQISDKTKSDFEQEEQELREEGRETIKQALDVFTQFAEKKSYRQAFLTDLNKVSEQLLMQSSMIIELKQKGVKGDEILQAKELLEILERKSLHLIDTINVTEKAFFESTQEDFKGSLQNLLAFGLVSVMVFILLSIIKHHSLNKRVYHPLHNLEEDIKLINEGHQDILQKLGSTIGTHEIDLIRQALYDLISQNERNLLRLAVAKQRAEEANKAKSYFLANMSHELRTPMHAIHNFTNLSLKYAEHDKQKRFLENTRVSAIRLTALLNNLLDLSKLEDRRMNADFNEQDLTALTVNCVEEVYSLLDEKQIRVVMDQETVHDAMFDQMLISQVLINLLSNAIKFSPENSEIRIRLSTIAKPIDDHEENYLRLEVIDQGIGIPDSELDEVFDKFVQSTKTLTSAGGTGLGLSISREIIKLHQGNIWAESPPQGESIGSAFIFEIPVVQRDARIVENISANDVIKSHLELKSAVLSVLDGQRGAETIPAEFLMNEGRTLLNDWLKKHQSFISNADILRLCHDEFHVLATELIGLCQVEKTSAAQQKQNDLITQSNKLVRLIQSQPV